MRRTPASLSQRSVAGISTTSFGEVAMSVTGMSRSAGRSGQSSSPAISPMPPIPHVTASFTPMRAQTAIVPEAVSAPDEPFSNAAASVLQSRRAFALPLARKRTNSSAVPITILPSSTHVMQGSSFGHALTIVSFDTDASPWLKRQDSTRNPCSMIYFQPSRSLTLSTLTSVSGR